MSYLTPIRSLPQKATYWNQSRQTGYGGETWDAPTVIDCRWETITEEALSVAYRVPGESINSRSIVFTRQPLVEGGYLFLGQSVVTNPSRLKGAFVIRTIAIIPTTDGRAQECAAYL